MRTLNINTTYTRSFNKKINIAKETAATSTPYKVDDFLRLVRTW